METKVRIEQTSGLNCNKSSGDNLKEPENFEIGRAIADGNCFFDSIRQGLEQLGTIVTVQQLRKICQEFAHKKSPPWFIDAIANSHDSHNVRRENPTEYIINIMNSDRWGDPEVEGRILCEKYKVKLHVIEIHNEVRADQIIDREGSKSIKNINYNEENTIHVVNRGFAHFEPVINKASDRSDNRQSQSNNKKEPKSVPSSNSRVEQPSSLLESRADKSDNDPQQSSSILVTDDIKVNDKLEEFVKYFVREFEVKCQAYHHILEGETKKAGKFSDAFSKVVGQGVGGVVGGSLGFFVGSPVGGAALGAKVGKGIANKIGTAKGNKKHAKKVTKLIDLIDLCQNDMANFRWEFIKAGFDVFQSYEMQFMRVTTDQGPKKAIQLLAQDATNRAINYLSQNNKEASITEGVISGESKIEPVLGIPVASLKTPGFEINYKYNSSEEKWYTSSLYGKVGLVIEEKTRGKMIGYYEKKYRKCRPDKYGYRRLLWSESWNKLKDTYITSNVVKSEQLIGYKYILNSKDAEQKRKDILTKINLVDKRLEEKRFTEIIEEVKDDIIKEINLLKKSSFRFIKDRKILTNIETNLKNLKADVYLKRFQGYFVEAKQERQNIIRTLKDASRQREEMARDNKDEHKKTQTGIKHVYQEINNVQKKQEVILNKLSILDKKNQEKSIEPIWFHVKHSVESFTGRERELSNLHEAMKQKDDITEISPMTAICGLGGIGKTELARKYADVYRHEYDGNVIWINAENYGTLENSFLELAMYNRICIPTELDGKKNSIESIIEEIYRFFAKRKSLFIFDNAEKYRTQEREDGSKDVGIDMFLPSLTSYDNKPYVLITSRNQRWGKIKVLGLGIFAENEAEQFIRKALNIDIIGESQKTESQKPETRLSETLQRFPLALQQAVAYIREREMALKTVGSKFDINDYLKRYDEETKKLLNFKFPEDSTNLYTKTTFTTWKITTDKIKENHEYGKQAGNILDIIAYFAPDRIPIHMFLRSELTGDDKEKLGDAVQLLKQHSMIHLGQDSTVMNVHRLVQQVTRINLKDQNKEEQTVAEGFELLKEFYSNKAFENYIKMRQLLPHLETFLSHVDDWIARKPENKQKIEEDYVECLLTMMAHGYSDSGDPQKQKSLLERALPILENHYGLDHFRVASTLDNLGVAYGDLSDAQKQKELHERALIILEKHYGPDDKKIALTLQNLGIAFGALGDAQKHKTLQERALVILEKHYDPDHYEVAFSLQNLGIAYGDLGDVQREKVLLERTLVILENNYGPKHFKIAFPLQNLGIVCGVLGDAQKQKELQERALIIIENHYGSDHYEVAFSLKNLANACGRLGDAQKQKELHERALNIFKNYYGPDHIDVATSLVDVGFAYGVLGDIQKQKELQEQALSIFEKHYGRNHFKIATTLECLGNSYGALGYHQKNKELQERALFILQKHHGPNHYNVAKTLVNLGNAYGALRDIQKRKELQEQALINLEKHYGPDHVGIASTLVNLGIAYGALGNHQKQKELQERALIILKKHYGHAHIEVASTLQNLGDAYGALGDIQEQIQLQERALSIFEKHYGREHLELASILVDLGVAYDTLGDTQKRKELHERALYIIEKNNGHDHSEAVIKLRNLGTVHISSDDHQKLKEFHKR